MKNTLALAFSLVALALPATAAHAATTVDVSTGQGSTGSADPLWTYDNGSSEGQAFIPTSIHPNWFSGGAPAGQNGNNDGARWVTVTSNGTATQPAGIINYTAIFTMSQVAQLADLTGTFWADNRVVSILLNGVAIYTNANNVASQFNGPGTSLNIKNLNLAGGSNTLQFVVENYPGASGNPAGLRFAGVFSAVPEPGTWMLMMLGLGAVGFSMRRRQKTQVRFQFA